MRQCPEITAPLPEGMYWSDHHKDDTYNRNWIGVYCPEKSWWYAWYAHRRGRMMVVFDDLREISQPHEKNMVEVESREQAIAYISARLMLGET